MVNFYIQALSGGPLYQYLHTAKHNTRISQIKIFISRK